MNKEEYVKFSNAKRLKEKGFDWEVKMYYAENGDMLMDFLNNFNSNALHGGGERVSAPTQQMACRWLREVHDIHIVPKKDFFGGDYTGRIYDGRRDSATACDDYIAIVGYDSYEAACDAALEYTLNNLI